MTSYPSPPNSRPPVEPSPSSYSPPVYSPPPVEPYSRTTYQPTAEQLLRDEALNRYNRKSITIPVVIISAIAVGLFVLLLVLAFGLKDTGQARAFIAGLSALTIIFISIPLILLMSILPIAYVAWWYNRREQRKLTPEVGPMAYRSRIQILLWQIDSYLFKAQRQVEGGSSAVTKPLIKAQSRWAYGQQFVRGIDQNFTRSEPNDQNNNYPPAGY